MQAGARVRHRQAPHVVRVQAAGPQIHAQGPRRREDDVGADRVEIDILPHDGTPTQRRAEQELAVRPAPQGNPRGPTHRPGPSVEAVEHDAAPAQAGQERGLLDVVGHVDAHDHRLVGLDLAERTQLHPVREARHHPAELGPYRQCRLAHPRDHEEQHPREDEGGGGSDQAHARELAAEPDTPGGGRPGGAARPLGLGDDVMEHEHPRGQQQEADEHDEEPQAEGHRGRGHEEEERKKARVSQITQRAAQEQPPQDQGQQQVHHAVQGGGGEIRQVHRDGDGGRGHQSPGHPRPDGPALARSLDPPAPEHGEHDQTRPGRTDQPRQEERGDPVTDEQVGRQAEREHGGHFIYLAGSGFDS